MAYDRAEGTSQRCGNPSAIIISRDFVDPPNSPVPLQVEDLQKRAEEQGFIDASAGASRFFLHRISYQHASEYFDCVSNTNPKTFCLLHRIMLLDRSLQSLLIEYIGLVELQMRAQYSYAMTKHGGPFAHRHRENFKKEQYFNSFLDIYKSDLKNQVKAHNRNALVGYEKYGDVPMWQAVEFMSLGTLSKLYSNTRSPAVKRQVADSFGVDVIHLENWLYALSSLRNRCAHFNRIVGRPLAIQPKRTTLIEGDNTHLFYLIQIIVLLLGSDVVFDVDGTLHYAACFVLDIANLLYRFDDVIALAGIPPNWNERLLTNNISGLESLVLPPASKMENEFQSLNSR